MPPTRTKEELLECIEEGQRSYIENFNAGLLAGRDGNFQQQAANAAAAEQAALRSQRAKAELGTQDPLPVDQQQQPTRTSASLQGSSGGGSAEAGKEEALQAGRTGEGAGDAPATPTPQGQKWTFREFRRIPGERRPKLVLYLWGGILDATSWGGLWYILIIIRYTLMALASAVFVAGWQLGYKILASFVVVLFAFFGELATYFWNVETKQDLIMLSCLFVPRKWAEERLQEAAARAKAANATALAAPVPDVPTPPAEAHQSPMDLHKRKGSSPSKSNAAD